MLETGKIQLEMSWLEQPRLCSVWEHRTVRWCTGLSGGAPDSVRCARLARANWPLSGIRRRRTSIIHRTVRCAPDCPVCIGLSGEPTVRRAIRARHVAEPTVGRGHRTVRCAPDSVRCANGSKAPTVGFAKEGKKSAPDCPVRQERIAFLECTQRLLAALGL